MRNIILLEFKKIKTSVITTILLSVCCFLLAIKNQITNTVFENSLEPWINAIDSITLFFPLIVVIPVCWVNYYERKDKFINYTLPRVSEHKMLSSKILVYLVCSFSIIFLTIFIGGVFSFLIGKPNIFELTGSYTASNHLIENRIFLGNILVNHPIIYILLQSVWDGILAAIICFMGVVLSLYSNSLLIILLGPFIYTTIENFGLSVLGVPHFRIVASFNPHIMQNTSLITIFVGPIIAVFMTLLIYLCYKYKESYIYNI